MTVREQTAVWQEIESIIPSSAHSVSHSVTTALLESRERAFEWNTGSFPLRMVVLREILKELR